MSEAQRAELAASDDLSIVARVRAGDHAAFELLMRRYNRRLYRLARASLRDDTEAKDALQDAYLSAFRSMAQFRGEAALGTWLSRLVLNECRARLRRSSRRQKIIPIISGELNTDEVAAGAESGELQAPDQLLTRAQMRSVIERKVSELPELFRVVFVLRSIEELSIDEIASTLDIPPETVRSRHFRAKGMLRESLAKEIDLAEGDIFEFGGTHCDQIVAAVLARIAR
jgi:RNA polymerase sigma-70 factor (ECF subfamily)